MQSFPYNKSTATLRKEIAELLSIVWTDTDSPSLNQNELPISHRAELAAQSFCCYFFDSLVGYAAVIHKEISHCGHRFMIAALSCVATHPDYRGCGVGSTVVSAATEPLTAQADIDFGIFTCHPDLAVFYQAAGDWQISSDIILIASHDAGALSSESLNVVVLMRLFSEKAQVNRASFCTEPISLEFPVGEFI